MEGFAQGQGDKDVVLAEIRRGNPYALENASAELRWSKEIVLEAVKQNGDALENASVELRWNKEIVMEAIK